MKVIYFALVASLLSACAFHGGMMTANHFTDPDCEIVGSGTGKASTVHVFGIGGLDHKNLMADAKKSLYANHPLRKGQTYANLTVNKRVFPYAVVFVTELSVSADIVRLTNDAESEEFHRIFEPPLNAKNIRLKSKEDIWVKAGDQVTVFTGNLKEQATVIKVLATGRIEAFSYRNGLRRYGIKNFFLTEENVRFRHLEFQTGDSVVVTYEGKEKRGLVEGVNPYFALVGLAAKKSAIPVNRIYKVNGDKE